jgi:hypothetical protein
MNICKFAVVQNTLNASQLCPLSKCVLCTFTRLSNLDAHKLRGKWICWNAPSVITNYFSSSFNTYPQEKGNRFQ